MKPARLLAALPLVLLLIFCTGMASNNKDDKSPSANKTEYADISGRDLMPKLLDSKTRSKAFYELWRRGNPDEDSDYDSFLEKHYSLEVIICPQENGNPPLYLVLHGFLRKSSFSSSNCYETPNPAELFPPTDTQSAVGLNDMRAIVVFTSDGKLIEPFGGNNCNEPTGMIADINGDGLVERADHMSYGVDGIDTVDVLHISAVKPEPQPLLDVLFNWGEDEWSYRLTDPDRDGIVDVELGPKVCGDIITKAVFKWDKSRKVYSGPTGKQGDHFRILDGTKLWSEFKKTRKARLIFSKDPDFVDERTMDNGPWARSGLKKPSPNDLSKPYRYISLKSLANEDIVRFMGRGKNMADLEGEKIIKSHVPTNFWSMNPKSAALATANENRYPDHQKRYRLAVDDRNGQQPPETCSLAFTFSSARCYTATDCHFFLRVDPKKSYLAYASSEAGGVVFFNFVNDQPAFDFRFCELPYEEARHLAQTIWWLNRVRSLSVTPADHNSMMSSTADGHGNLALRNEFGETIVRLDDTLWASYVSERWGDNYSPEVCLNLASFLIEGALTDHLGNRWSQSEPKQALIEPFLDLFSPEQTSNSFAIVNESARAAGGFVLTNLSAKLAYIQSRLPAINTSNKTENVQKLHDTISLSIKKIRLADDLQALQEWASSKEPGFPWALQRLKSKDPKRYVAALEWWMKNTKDKWVRQAYEAIAKEDSQRAVEIAKDIPAGEKEPLTVSAFAHLAAVDGIPDEQKRIKALIAIALEPKSGWEERCHAIDQLVPPGQPLRYPTRDIDAALVKLLRPRKADEDSDFTMERACRGLALRQRTEYFHKMADALEKTEDAMSYTEALGAVTQLAQCDPAKFNPRLVALLKPQLSRTNKGVPDILMAIWSADLRDLKPDLERLATSAPEDYEDERANSFGGNVGDIEGRFHLARKIVSLWNEEDPLAKCRLLLAFGLNDAHDYVDDSEPERLSRMKIELATTAQALTPEQRKQVNVFLDWYQSKHIDTETEEVYRQRRAKFMTLAKGFL